MKRWLEIPRERKRLPVGRLCLILALTILMMLALMSRKSAVLAELGLAVFGLA